MRKLFKKYKTSVIKTLTSNINTNNIININNYNKYTFVKHIVFTMTYSKNFLIIVKTELTNLNLKNNNFYEQINM